MPSATPLFALAVLFIFSFPLPAFAGQTVNINGSVTGDVYGNGSGINNTVTPSDSTFDAEGDTVSVNSGGSVTGRVQGGFAFASGTGISAAVTASGNSVNISGTTSYVYGGFAASTTSGAVTAQGNSVNISNGTMVNGDVYSGRGDDPTATATGNTVTISGPPPFGTFTALYGGYTATSGGTAGNAFTDNTLNLHTSGITVANVYNFENLNFYLPSTLTASTTPLLTVTGTANLTDGGGTTQGNRSSIVRVDIDAASSPLKEGDAVTLISATTLVTNGDLDAAGTQGVALKYEFGLDISSAQLIAKVTQVELNPQTQSFSEARLSQLAFGNQGTDLIAGQGLSAALDATARRTNMKETTVFGAISGGSSRYKTGSHSDVSGVSLIAGLAGCSQQTLGKLTLGAFFEYGNANYDSYNSFVNADSVHGKGDTDYTGGGVLAHFELNPTARGNAWLESSARFGESSVDFKTGDMFDNKSGRHAAFASENNYAAAHIGLGYHWNLTKQNGFDIYAQYLWSRQNADTAELTTGETIRFETANSERLRLGSRFVYNLNPHRRAYAGIAWEHEFDGEANASIYGFRLLDTPKLTGDTCKLELGLTLQPTKTCPVTRNFGIQGYTGKREGIAGSIEVRYEF
ncbi:membrane protein [Planctomycetales bacterium]|nr:membrane protein [Planctomycetales bacterium]